MVRRDSAAACWGGYCGPGATPAGEGGRQSESCMNSESVPLCGRSFGYWSPPFRLLPIPITGSEFRRACLLSTPPQ